MSYKLFQSLLLHYVACAEPVDVNTKNRIHTQKNTTSRIRKHHDKKSAFGVVRKNVLCLFISLQMWYFKNPCLGAVASCILQISFKNL